MRALQSHGNRRHLFALGYGQHETAPGRVLPFYPAFLAGMSLVVLAGDPVPGYAGFVCKWRAQEDSNL